MSFLPYFWMSDHLKFIDKMSISYIVNEFDVPVIPPVLPPLHEMMRNILNATPSQSTKQTQVNLDATLSQSKKQSHAECKLHNRRKIECTDCAKLFKQDPSRYECPSGICRVHLKRKCRCDCNKVLKK